MPITKVTHSMIEGSVIDVLDYGAVGDGVADDTNAVIAAITAANAAKQAGSGGTFGGSGVAAGTAPTVYFPSGVYKITSSLSADTVNNLAYLNFVGEQSILVLSPSIVCFGGVGYMTNFKNLQFRGGAVAISIKTGNTDTSLIDITGCDFNDQTTASIRTDTNSNSTLLTISNCKYNNYQSTGYFLYAPTGDRIDITQTWVTSYAPAAFYIDVGQLSMYEMVGIPNGALAQTGGRWVDFMPAAQSLICYNCRFGGEGGGAPLVYNYATPDTTSPFLTSQIIVKDCDLFMGLSDRLDRGVVIAKAGLPGIVRIEGCRGPSSSYFINDQMTTGTLVDWLNTYQNTTALQGTLSIAIINTETVGVSLSTSADLDRTLRPFLIYESPGNIPSSTVKRQVDLPYVDALTVRTQVAQGTSYPMTGVSTTTAIVDTGIYYSTPITGYSIASIYDVHISGNPNVAGSAAYNTPLYGVLVVGSGAIASIPKTEVFYADVYKPNFSGLTEFTVSAVFWNGISEASSITPSDTSYQIRLKINGFVSSTGTNLVVRITKRL